MDFETIVTPAGRYYYDRLHFAQARKANGVLYCSGVIGTDEKGRLPASLAEEFDLAWQNLQAVLKAGGSGLDRLLDCTSYHVGMSEHLAEFVASRKRVLTEPWPPWTAIGTTELALPGAHVEIKATALAS